MPVDLYEMTDEAIAKDIGGRLDQLRLEANLSQQQVADELAITPKTYRNIIQGKAKLENIIGILRVLNQLEQLDSFIPPTSFSPLEMLAMQGKKRQRASKAILHEGKASYGTSAKTSENDDLDW